MMKYGRMCCTTVLPRATNWPIMFIYWMQSNEDTLLDIYSESQFAHWIEDGNRSSANWVTEQENISFQKVPVIFGYLSLTIILGIPCSFWIIYMNVVGNVIALKGWEREQKWAYFVSQSTTTMMTLFPLNFSRLVIKSIETSF